MNINNWIAWIKEWFSKNEKVHLSLHRKFDICYGKMAVDVETTLQYLPKYPKED